MIYGIGIDIVEIERFNSSEKVEKFSKRILSSQEKNIYHSLDSKNKHVYIAKQFALKEAISKALGTGIRGGVNFKDLQILRDDNGKPFFDPLNKIQDILKDLGIKQSHVSLSDENNYVTAIAILEI
jgi:holo-[acyl-carrier protein] synthase